MKTHVTQGDIGLVVGLAIGIALALIVIRLFL